MKILHGGNVSKGGRDVKFEGSNTGRVIYAIMVVITAYRQEQMGKVRIVGTNPNGVATNASRPPQR